MGRAGSAVGPVLSVIAPSRGRPERFAEMLASLRATATSEVEVIAVFDLDDETVGQYPLVDRYVVAPHGTLPSDLWNIGWEQSTGDIGMLCADDAIFRSIGWDTAVREAFTLWPDRIGMVYTANGNEMNRPEFPFVSWQWIDVAGFFTPPYFRSWFADKWIWDVAALIRRRQFLPDVLIEHMSVDYGKAELDDTYERARKARRTGADQRLYARLEPQRNEQAAKLLDACQGSYAWDEREFT